MVFRKLQKGGLTYLQHENQGKIRTRRTGSIVRLEYPTKEAKQAASRHYLYNKAKEFSDIEEKAASELLQNLEKLC